MPCDKLSLFCYRIILFFIIIIIIIIIICLFLEGFRQLPLVNSIFSQTSYLPFHCLLISQVFLPNINITKKTRILYKFSII